MRVIIVGGGIGGVAAAIALQRQGIESVVLERARAIADVGAGVAFTSNGVRVLAHLDCLKHTKYTAVRIEQAISRGMKDDAIINSVTIGDLTERTWGYPACALHRSDLLAALLAELDKGRLRLNACAVAFEERPDGVSVQLATGETVSGDVLVGADGLRSAVRAWRFGEVEPRFIDTVCWRAVFPIERISSFDPRSTRHVWFGAGRSIVSYPLRGNTLFNFVGYVPAEETSEESWTQAGSIAAFHKTFDGSSPQVMDLVAAADNPYVSGLYFRDPIPDWSTARTTLLGDAAHPTLPTAAQGSQMALEDSVILAGCLGRAGNDIPAALSEYVARRFPRTAQIVTRSRANERRMTWSDPVLLAARDRRARGMSRIDPINAIANGWLEGYDAVAELDRPVGADANATNAYTFKRAESRRAASIWQSALTPEECAGNWPGERAGYERFCSETFPLRDGFTTRTAIRAGVTTIDIVSREKDRHLTKDDPVVLHLHGGGFVLGSAAGSLSLAARLADAAGGFAVAVDYRLSPEHCFPAALDDVVAVYRDLIAVGHRSIILTGEDAGGSLALSACSALKDENLPPPTVVYAVSPITDLSLASRGAHDDKLNDPWYSLDTLAWAAAAYVQETKLSDTRLSPVNADLSALPPTIIHAARNELLHHDCAMFAAKAMQAGAEVTFRAFEDSVHSFVLFDFLPETTEALAGFGAAVRARTAVKV